MQKVLLSVTLAALMAMATVGVKRTLSPASPSKTTILMASGGAPAPDTFRSGGAPAPDTRSGGAPAPDVN
jgi:hypothetical protein